jgi:outer membrane receptor protein involved in Fe transport
MLRNPRPGPFKNLGGPMNRLPGGTFAQDFEPDRPSLSTFHPMLSLLLFLFLPVQAPTQSESYVYAPRDEAPLSTPAAERTVVSGEALRATGERSLPKALAQAIGPGVWMQETNLGGGSAFIRGLTGNQILILVDGVRLNDSTTRFGPNQILNTIDPAIVESIEVRRGPSSVLYGSDAIGGVIHVHTRRETPGGEGLRGSLDSEVVSAVEGGSLTPAMAWSGSQDGLIFVGTAFDYRDLQTGSGFEPPTAYDGYAAFAAWTRDFGSGRRLSISAWQHRDDDVPRTDKLFAGFGQTNPKNDIYNFALQDRRQVLFAYADDELDMSLADSMALRFSVRSYDEEREKQKFGSTKFTFERDETDSLGLGGDWKKWLGDEHLLTYGFDLDFDQVDSTRRDTDGGVTTPKDGQFAPNAEYTAFGLFVQDELFGFEPFDVTAGVRFSAYDFSFDGFGGGPSESGDFTALTASLQAARDLGEGHRVAATLAQGFRAPNLDDLAKDGDFGGGTELHNADLDPERSLTVELAYEYARSGESFAAAVFGTEIDDVIGRRLSDPGGPATGDETYLRDNAGTVRLWGAELGGDVRLGPESPLTIDYGLAYVIGRQVDDTIDISTGTAPFDGVDWRRVPPLNGRVGLTWRPDTLLADAPGGIGFESARLGVTFADKQDKLHPGDVSDPRIDPNGTPGWARIDLDFTGPFGSSGSGFGGRSRWTLGVHNLFDAAYRVHGSGFDAPGFTFALGLHWAP